MPEPTSDQTPITPATDQELADTTVEWVASAARNRAVRLVVSSPPGRDRATLPLCVGLHGLGANALWWGDPGMRHALGAAWASGVPPFVVAALDGGDNYWHAVRPGDDPMRMLLDELPGWMTQRGLARDTRGVPALAAGVSMGGAGALMYARERAHRGAPVRAVLASALVTLYAGAAFLVGALTAGIVFPFTLVVAVVLLLHRVSDPRVAA